MMRTSLQIEPGFYLFLACGIIFVPLPWFAAWFIASAFHELCHWLALKYRGIDVYRMKMTGCGMFLQTQAMTAKDEILCALAGPFGGIILLLAANVLPRIALCAAIQSAYNLLPLYPLDGGRALRTVWKHFCKSEHAERIQRYLSAVVYFGLVAGCFVISLYFQAGVYSIVFLVLLMIRNKIFLANDSSCEYNIINRKI